MNPALTATVQGTSLYYETVGSGIPVLVLHGGLGFDHTYFRPWLDALGDHAEIIYYDHRGNGRSASPESWDVIDHGTWIDDADALRAYLGHERIVVFGHSHGGVLAQEYALRYRDRLAGLILCNTSPVYDYVPVSLALAEAKATPEQYAALLRLVSAPATSDTGFEEAFNEVLPVYFCRPERAKHSHPVKNVRFNAAAFNRAFFGCLPTFNMLDKLHLIDVPTLALTGAHDWIAPPAQSARRLANGVPGAEVVILEESGHFPFVEQNEVFVQTVGAWLQRHFRKPPL